MACLVEVPRYDDDVRAALDAEGIFETFKTTSPDADSDRLTRVRLTVPAASEAAADARLVRALHPHFERMSSWGHMPDDWEG